MMTAVQARMPLVGRTADSPMRALSRVDLPAPVLPTTTTEAPGMVRVPLSCDSAADRLRLRTSEPQSANSRAPMVFASVLAAHWQTPMQEASAFSCASTALWSRFTGRAAAAAAAGTGAAAEGLGAGAAAAAAAGAAAAAAGSSLLGGVASISLMQSVSLRRTPNALKPSCFIAASSSASRAAPSMCEQLRSTSSRPANAGTISESHSDTSSADELPVRRRPSRGRLAAIAGQVQDCARLVQMLLLDGDGLVEMTVGLR